MKVFNDTTALAAATLTAGQMVSVKEVGEYRIKASGSGITLANGNIAVPVASGTAVNIKQFGAVGDGVADDTAAVQAAVDYCGNNAATLTFPAGSYLFSGITIDTSYRGLTIKGEGNPRVSGISSATYFRNNSASAMFSITGSGTCTNLTIENFSFGQVTTSDGAFFTSTNSLSQCAIKNCTWFTPNPASNFINVVATSIDSCVFENHYGSMATGATAPSYYIEATVTGSYFGNVFKDLFLNSNNTATAPLIRLEDSTAGATNGTNSFKNIVLEVAANGGGIHATGVRHSTFERIYCDDKTANGAHLIHLSTNAAVGSQASSFNTFIDCISNQGTATWKDLYVEHPSSGSQTTLINCLFGYVDIEGQPFTNIGSNVLNDVSVAGQIKVSSGVVTLPSGHTVSEMESGQSGVISASGNVSVTFATPFSSAPNVVVSHAAGTSRDGPLTVSGITTTGFTVSNWATAATQAQWIAIN